MREDNEVKDSGYVNSADDEVFSDESESRFESRGNDMPMFIISLTGAGSSCQCLSFPRRKTKFPFVD